MKVTQKGLISLGIFCGFFKAGDFSKKNVNRIYNCSVGEGCIYVPI